MEEITVFEEKQTKRQAKRTRYVAPRYSCVHLKFLTDFMAATEMTVKEFAGGSMSANVALRRQLQNDEMLLSKAKELLENHGYKLTVKLNDKNPDPKTAHVAIILDLPQIKTQNENVGFIFDLAKRRKLTENQLAEKLGLSPGAIWAWKRVDDIKISYLYLIKDTLDCELEFRIEKA